MKKNKIKTSQLLIFNNNNWNKIKLIRTPQINYYQINLMLMILKKVVWNYKINLPISNKRMQLKSHKQNNLIYKNKVNNNNSSILFQIKRSRKMKIQLISNNKQYNKKQIIKNRK